MISDSINIFDYEILVRKKSCNDYAVYCPQLNFMLKGNELDTLKDEMKAKINEHIKSIAEKQEFELE